MEKQKFSKLIIRYSGDNSEMNKALVELAKKYEYVQAYQYFNFANKTSALNFNKIIKR